MYLIVLRGLPGSGKTTYSNKLVQLNPDIKVISNDSLRINENEYNYTYENNNYIYQENYRLLIDYLSNKTKIIIIDNCNLNPRVLDIYYNLSIKYNYHYLQVAFPKSNKENIFENISRCQHNISNSTYQKLWLSYQNHYMDKDVNKINLTYIATSKDI